MKIFGSSFIKAKVLGVMSGMRTTAGLFFTNSLVSNSHSKSGLVRFLQKKPVTAGITLMGMTELVIDKLPGTPDRIAKGGIIFRTAAGALCGAAIYQADGKKAITGAVIGSFAALASTYLFFYGRKTLGERTGIKDHFIGAAEDALAIAGGIVLVKTKKPIL